MNHPTITEQLIAIVLVIFLLFPLLSVFAKAYDNDFYPQNSSQEMWTLVDQRNDILVIWSLMHEKGLISPDVDYSTFDYICVLTQQLCTMTNSVTSDIAIAMIAWESNFNIHCQTDSAKGLMQLIPIYHSRRMEQFVEAGHKIDLDDFYDPRLNIATGLDYLDYILGETRNDVTYALMWYNQGATSASKDYIDYRKISTYARNVQQLAEEIKPYLERRVC